VLGENRSVFVEIVPQRDGHTDKWTVRGVPITALCRAGANYYGLTVALLKLSITYHFCLVDIAKRLIYCCVESSVECGISDDGCLDTAAADWNAADWH